MNTCGWFKFEYDPLTIRHVYTNQSVMVKDGRALNRDGTLVCEYASPNDGDLILFDLELDNITRARKFHVPEFRVNYNSIYTSPPDYSRWKIIDDFLTDALTCWPEFLTDRRSPPNLRVEGGWCNGRWTPNLIRMFTFEKDATFLERSQTSTPAEPAYTLRKADQQWEYVEYESPQQSAALDYACPPPSFVPYLGRDEPVTGFQGKVPYLATKDRRAYIAPISFSESMGHDDCLHPHADYVYLNDNFFYQFEMRNQSAIWMLLFIYYYGFRDLMVEKSYWPLALGSNEPVPPTSPRKPKDIFTNHFLLPYRVWRESVDAITDAWSAWRNPARKVVGLRDSYVGGFEPNYCDRFFPSFRGGYSAGLSNEKFRVGYKYAQPIVLPDAAR